MNASEHPPRYHSLDALRAAMMLLGIYLHSAVAYSEYGSWPWKDGTTTAAFDVSLGLIHVFRMPVFFALAGFFAALLLESRGAGGFLRNRVHRILVPFVVGWILLFPLVAALAVAGMGLEARDTPATNVVRLFGSLEILRRRPDPMHLWFLEYLVLFYALAIAAIPFSRHLGGIAARVDGIFRTLLRSPVGPSILAVMTTPILLLMEAGAIDDPSGFVPEARIGFAYVVLFGWGWFLRRNVDLLPVLQSALRAVIFLIVGIVAALLGYFLWYWLRSNDADVLLGFLVSAWCLSLSMWLFVFGLIGVFLRFLERPVPWIRYVSDSSYWLYLVHMPVLLLFQLAVAETDWLPVVKALVVLAASVATLLGSYHILVRPTWVGAVLNGRRVPIRRRRRYRASLDAGRAESRV